MMTGLVAGFGAVIGWDRLTAMAHHGLAVLRQDLQTTEGRTPDVAGVVAECQAWVAQSRGQGRVVYICSLDTLAQVPNGSWVELHNEPDLRMSPEQWAADANAAKGVIEAKGLVLWGGGISNLTESALAWLARAVALAPWLTRVTVHRYTPGRDQNPTRPHAGFSSREAEVAALRAIIGNRPFFVGEVGYHMGPMKPYWWQFWKRTTRLTAQQQAERLTQERAFWEAQGAAFTVIYQEQDSPDPNGTDQYGLRYCQQGGVMGAWKTDTLYGIPFALDPIEPVPPVPGGPVSTFKSWHGMYLSCQPDGRVECNRPDAGAWESFTAEPQPDGWTAYRSCFGTYLRAVDDGSMDCTATSAGPWECFKSVAGCEAGWSGLQTWHGTYVRADIDGVTVNQADSVGPWESWDLGHVDPSTIPLETLAKFRGGMWVNRAAIPYGPRPGQPSNINAMDYYQWYNAPDRATMLAAYRAQGYTHAVTGPVIDSGGYHGQYPVYPGPLTQAWWDTYLDAMQEWWDAGITPVHFACPDDADWPLDRIKAELGPFFAQDRAQRLLRVLVLAWEPSSWTNARYVETAKWLHGLFPNALMCLHTEPNHNAPGLSSEIEAGMTEAQMWANVAPYIHCFLQQTDAPFRGSAEDQQEWLRMWDRRYQGSWDSRFLDGYHGWPTFSAWGTHGILAYPAEYMSYDCYWNNTPESVAQSWGDRAMAYGARGYLDGGTVPVP